MFDRLVVLSMLNWKALSRMRSASDLMSSLILRPLGFIIAYQAIGLFARGNQVGTRFALGMVVITTAGVVSSPILEGYAQEVRFGTTPAIIIARSSRTIRALSRCLYYLPIGVACGLVSLGIVAALLDHSVFVSSDIMGACLAIGCAQLSIAALAMWIGPLCLIYRQWVVMVSLIDMTLLLCSGAIIPTSVLPPALGVLGGLVPCSHSVVAFREAISGAPVVALFPELVREIGVAVLFAALSTLSHRFVENRIRSRSIY